MRINVALNSFVNNPDINDQLLSAELQDNFVIVVRYKDGNRGLGLFSMKSDIGIDLAEIITAVNSKKSEVTSCMFFVATGAACGQYVSAQLIPKLKDKFVNSSLPIKFEDANARILSTKDAVIVLDKIRSMPNFDLRGPVTPQHLDFLDPDPASLLPRFSVVSVATTVTGPLVTTTATGTVTGPLVATTVTGTVTGPIVTTTATGPREEPRKGAVSQTSSSNNQHKFS